MTDPILPATFGSGATPLRTGGRFSMDPIPLPGPHFPLKRPSCFPTMPQKRLLRHNVPWEGCQIRPGQGFSPHSSP